MRIKHSAIHNFKLVTGANLFEVIQKAEDKADFEKMIEAIQVLTLGLYLLDSFDVVEARSEYRRLNQKDNESERFDILDAVDVFELLEDLNK